MLRVTTIHASTAAPSARYYTRYLADDGPDGEGHWLGQQADGLGLTGSVSTDDLEALLSGRDPVTGTQLGAPLVDRVDAKGRLIHAVAGFDATFSAPKSVSVWWGLTGDPGLLDAHNTAVRAVLDHLERFGATTRVRANDARQHPDTRGLTMAAFHQATSREDDPQLHTHVVISTKVQTGDARWLALDARYLKRKQRALGGLYKSVLRAELTRRYGVVWEAIEQGQAEITGMPRDLLDAFSKRTTQVDIALAHKIREFRQQEGRDPSRWERATLTREAAKDSRTAKSHESHGALASRWRDEAAALGWTPPRLLAAMRTTAREVKITPPSITVAEVLEQLSTNGSSWTRADVLQAICDLAPPVSHRSGHDWAKAVENAGDRVIDACMTLDPPDVHGPKRASDGRSIWLPPSEPHLTHDRVLAQEERLLTFALDAQDEPATPSVSLDRAGLDLLQADAAAAVAGYDQLVLVVGPAGTGKTTTMRRAVEDLRRQRRPVIGIAPTAKAAKVLRDETRIPTNTVAKLLYEWRTGQPRDNYRLPAGTTIVVDEAGMCGTGPLDDLVRLAVSQRWRLVLVGDPRQLHAVGRGGMFDELCRIGRAHELATIHRFSHRWEQRASLQLRAGDPEALDPYFEHRRVVAVSFDALGPDIARRWIDHTADQKTVAVLAETNEHVDALNFTIQHARRDAGQLGDRIARIAGGETAAVGDHVVTRRNDRSICTDRGEPVLNRDRWIVTAVHGDGGLTVSHAGGHGAAELSTEYARSNLRLGYAATAHGLQGDTVDVGFAVITESTSHRSLYVGATRGRNENYLYVVSDEPENARDVLERVLTNERADIPAVVQRLNLARHVPALDRQAAEHALTAARRATTAATERAAPHRQAVRDAENAVWQVRREIQSNRRARGDAPIWRRPALKRSIAEAGQRLAVAEARLNATEDEAAPYLADVQGTEARLSAAENAAAVARVRHRLVQSARPAPERSLERGRGIDF
jgi:conjugative relaxase-like TrwC/TraI family protein